MSGTVPDTCEISVNKINIFHPHGAYILGGDKENNNRYLKKSKLFMILKGDTCFGIKGKK